MANEQFKTGEIRGEYDTCPDTWQSYSPKRTTAEGQALIDSLQYLLLDQSWQTAATSGLYLPNTTDCASNQRKVAVAFYSDRLTSNQLISLDTILKPEFRSLVTNQVYSPIPYRKIDITPTNLGNYAKQPEEINAEFLLGLKSPEVVTEIICAPAATYRWDPPNWALSGEASNAIIFDVRLLNLFSTITQALAFNHQVLPEIQALIRPLQKQIETLQETNEILLEAQRHSTGFTE